MATIAGTALLKFGTFTVTGYIVESESIEKQSEDLEIEDESGDIVSHVYDFAKKDEVTVECIVKASTAVPAIGAVFTMGDSPATKFRVLSVGRQRSKRDVEKWTIRGKGFPGITLT